VAAQPPVPGSERQPDCGPGKSPPANRDANLVHSSERGERERGERERSGVGFGNVPIRAN
jgi:hypothetical protein